MPTRRFLLSVVGILLPGSLLLSPVLATSETHVNVNTTGNNSYSNVSVTNNSTSDTHTDIKMETNGEVQEYHSDDDEDVSITSKDGQSVISVSNSGKKPTASPKPSATVRPAKGTTPSATPDPSRPAPTTALKPAERQPDEQTHQSFFASFFLWFRRLFQ